MSLPLTVLPEERALRNLRRTQAKRAEFKRRGLRADGRPFQGDGPPPAPFPEPTGVAKAYREFRENGSL